MKIVLSEQLGLYTGLVLEFNDYIGTAAKCVNDLFLDYPLLKNEISNGYCLVNSVVMVINDTMFTSISELPDSYADELKIIAVASGG